jgi:hypothetical protein
MRLVHQHQIGFRNVAALQCLNARDLNLPRVVGKKVVRLDDADIADALRKEPLDRLINERKCWNGEDRAPSMLQFVFGDRRGHDGLTEAGGSLNHYAAATGFDRQIELVKQMRLLGT